MNSTLQAKDIMTVDAVTVNEDDSILDAADTLLAHRASNAPVVKTDFGRRILLGFVSEKDLMQCYASGAFYTQPELKVASVMRPHPVCVKPETDVFSLAAVFMQHGFRHLPVVVSQVLQGMVSRRDVLAALVSHYREWDKRGPGDRQPPDLAAIFTPRFLIG